MTLFPIRDMQTSHKDWTLRNFGNRPIHQPLLGLIEELGELSHSRLKAEQGIRGTQEEHLANEKDAVADIVIFASDYCSARGWDMAELLEATTFSEVQRRIYSGHTSPYSSILVGGKFLGRLVEAHMDEKETEARDAMKGLIFALAIHCAYNKWDLEELVSSTWEKVSKRDWKKNATTGATDGG